jgi:hypothetical protein
MIGSGYTADLNVCPRVGSLVVDTVVQASLYVDPTRARPPDSPVVFANLRI